ncbi:hypothetical protein F4054_07350 [Candidatus Poribacteria bacterium]|nr:hypothetical protein [Candidatus Poribacteria bacterium]MYG09018.1 hypothetical protein [Candidatus Poribacteria bacterium]MYK22059.1 hypothetical protein [Candidatus Poribacteria bacterium]
MFRDLLSSRWFQAGFAFFVLCVGGSLLYSWHVHRTTDAEFGKRPQPVVSIENRSPSTNTASTNTAPVNFQTEGIVNTPDANTDTPMSDATEAETIDETELIDMADAFLPDDDVSADALDPSKMSRFGLGPYPEIPKEWGFVPNYWEFMVDSIEDELLSRVTIKMKKEGTRSKYGSVGVSPTGQVIALERGSVLVEYEIDENGDKRIWSVFAHPDDLSAGIYTSESKIPSNLKIVTADEIAFDAYEYLGLPK